MTNQNDNFLVKSTMTYGLYVGVAISLVIMLYHLSGQIHVPGDKTGFVNTLLMSFGMLVFGRKYQREFYPDGILYKQALGFCILLSVFAAIIFAFFSYWYYKVIEPNAIQLFMSQVELMLNETTNLPAEQGELVMQMYRQYLGAGALAFGAGFNQIISGVIFSFVVSYFIKSPLHLNKVNQSK